MWGLISCVFFPEPPASTYKHHKFDPTYPGICFLGNPKQAFISPEGQSLNWEDIGITLHVPPGAVPEDKQLNLTVRPCLCGPFVLPEGYELASPVYLITPAFDFMAEVELSISHFANLETEADSKRMVFVSARSAPRYVKSRPQYKFKVLPNGSFEKGMQQGNIILEHFCNVAAAQTKDGMFVFPRSFTVEWTVVIPLAWLHFTSVTSLHVFIDWI